MDVVYTIYEGWSNQWWIQDLSDEASTPERGGQTYHQPADGRSMGNRLMKITLFIIYDDKQGRTQEGGACVAGEMANDGGGHAWQERWPIILLNAFHGKQLTTVSLALTNLGRREGGRNSQPPATHTHLDSIFFIFMHFLEILA